MKHELPDARKFSHKPLEYVETFMIMNGISTKDMAETLGMKRSSFSMMMNGKRRMPLSAIRIAVVEFHLDPFILLSRFECEGKETRGEKKGDP